MVKLCSNGTGDSLSFLVFKKLPMGPSQCATFFKNRQCPAEMMAEIVDMTHCQLLQFFFDVSRVVGLSAVHLLFTTPVSHPDAPAPHDHCLESLYLGIGL